MRTKDLVNPVRWFAFVQSYLMTWFVPFHIMEQVVYRSVMCEDCLEAGKCKHCGCHTPALFYGYYISCEEGKWGPFMNKKMWNEYKRIMNIKLSL